MLIRNVRASLIVKTLAIVLLANLALVNLVFAQTPSAPPPQDPNNQVLITKADLLEAQGNIQACYAFAYGNTNALTKITGGNFKALWRTKQKTVITTLPIGPGGIPIPVPQKVIGDPLDSSDPGDKCLIVPGSATAYKDSRGQQILGDFYQEPQPDGSKQLQTSLKEGKGISQRDFTTAYIKDQQAISNAGPVSSAIGWVLNGIFSVVNIVIAHLTALAGAVFNQAVKWVLNQTIPDVVTVGWGIVRDFANMFFILILIIIALAAILRIESYDYRHLLGELVMMAVLVNFSKVIAVTLIHFVDLISIMFAPHGWGEIYAFIWNYTFKDLQSLPNGWMAGLAQGITKLMLSIIGLVTFLALAGLLVVRLVGLYVLIIFSPMAYVLDILPATKHYAHEWWEYFAKYLIWVPISFFMLRLTILLAQSNALESSDSAFSYIILMAFMWGSVIVAEHAGMVGGQAVVNGVEKGLHHGAEFVGRAYTKKITQKARQATLAGNTRAAGIYKGLGFLNPVVAKKAWEQRSHHLEEEVYEPAVGYAHDTLNRVMPTEWHEHGGKLGLGRKTNFGDIEYNRVINKKTKEFNEAPLTEEQRVQLYQGATHLDDKIAILRSLVANRHEDGLAAAWGVPYNSTDFKQRIYDDLKHSGATSEQIGVEFNHISELAEEGRKIRGMGMGVVDADGVARASVDLSWIDKLAEREDKDTEIVKTLRSLNVINSQNQFIDRKGEVKATITDYDSFKQAMASTQGGNINNGEVLEREIKAARAAKETIKRLKRTDNEDVVKAMEPAAFAQQELDGSYVHLHSEGARILDMMNPSVGLSASGMRRVQARFQALVGGSQKEDGTIDYTAVLQDRSKQDILLELAHESPEVAAGFLSKGKIEKSVAESIVQVINNRLEHEYVGDKKATKFLKVDSKGEFTVEHHTAAAATPPPTPPPPPSGRNPESGTRTLEVGPDGNFIR